jgi:hypothetical protein
MIGKPDAISGNFNFQSARADAVNLFSFVEALTRSVSMPI